MKQKYEYRVVMSKRSVCGTDFENDMNYQAKLGWEWVGVIENGTTPIDRNPAYLHLVFRREIYEEDQ